MKKTMIFAAFAALISLSSCQKEDVIDNGTDNIASPVFTASISGATKTTVNVTDGKVAWETSDEITITDASSASAVYTIESIDETTGKATFVFKEGDAIATAPYTATYGTEPATSQTYSATAGRLYMTAESSTNSFTFNVQCGLMKLNLTKTGESVKSIAVSSSTATYTLTCTEAQSIASAKDFYIALPAGSYTKIVITNSDDKVCTLNSASGLAIAANHIKPVTFDGTKLNFVPATKGTAMRTGNVKVNWVQLWENGPKFAEYNIGAANNSPEDYGGYYAWGGSQDKVNDRDANNKVNLTGDYDTATKLWGENWRMPTRAEFNNAEGGLLYECTCKWIANYNNTGINGLLCTGKGDYVSNSIFLPAAGQYSYSIEDCYDDSFCVYYWSSNINTGTKRSAYALYYYSDDDNSVKYLNFTEGNPVRAVLAEE